MCRNTKLDTFFFIRRAKDFQSKFKWGEFKLQHLLLCSKLQRTRIRSQEGILKVLKYWKRNTYSALEFLYPNPLKIRFCIYHFIKQKEFQAVVTIKIWNVTLTKGILRSNTGTLMLSMVDLCRDFSLLYSAVLSCSAELCRCVCNHLSRPPLKSSVHWAGELHIPVFPMEVMQIRALGSFTGWLGPLSLLKLNF